MLCDHQLSEDVLTTKCVNHHVRPTEVILDGQVIVLQELEPPSLPQVQFLLGEKVFKASTISEDLAVDAVKIVPPQLKRENHCREL